MATHRRFRFPNPVDETSARLVASGVVLQAIVFFVTRQGWLLIPLTYGFLARVLAGPSFSPLGQFVTRVVTPRVHVQHRFVPGPPKRFAQAVGVVFSGGALLSWGLDAHVLAYALVAGLLVAASLEAFAAVCLGCIVFARLMRWGIIPESVCEECNDLSSRLVPSA